MQACRKDTVPPPFEQHPRKFQNIETAKGLLAGKMGRALNQEVTVIPVSAYLDFENGQVVYDCRWNIDKLLEFLIEKLPKSALMQLARISRIKSLQKKMARIIIGASTALAAGIGAVPLPIADLPVLVTVQCIMIVGIGYVAGREMNMRSARDFLGALGINVGAAFVFREVARALIKFIFPGVGAVVAAGVAGSATWGLGEAAIAYFIEGKSPEEAREVFERAKKAREQDKEGQPPEPPPA